MATYNTALGVLPSPQTQLFGGNAGGGVGGAAPRQRPAQPRPAARQMGGQQTQTFAQMQQQGQARPAPPPREVAPDAFMTAKVAPSNVKLEAGKNFIDMSRPEVPAGATPTPWVTYGGNKQVTSWLRPAGVEQYQYIRGVGRDEVVENPWYEPSGGNLPSQVSQALGGATSAPAAGGQVSPDMMASLQALFAQGGFEGMQGAFAGVGEGVEGGGMDEGGMAFGDMGYEDMGDGGMGGMGAAPAMGYGAPSAAAPFALGQAFQQGTTTQALTSRLLSRLTGMEEEGSVYDDPAFAAQREAAMANLEAERQASQMALDEEMARRGIAASSIAAGRMGDIAGQFARAQATMEADLLKEAMAREQQRQQFLVQQLGQTLGTVGEQELGVFRANVESSKAQADINARAAELAQNERLKGRELDLQSARDMATKEYQSGQLALGYAEMSSRERVAANELAARERLQQQQQTFQAGESRLDREQRTALQSSEQAFQASQNAKERALREAIQLSETTGRQYVVDAEGKVVPKLDRNGNQIETNAAEQSRLSREQNQSQFERAQASADKDRLLREAIAMSETTGQQYTVDATGKVVPKLDANGKPMATSAVEQNRLNREAQSAQAQLDRALRERLGMTEATGILYGADGKPVLDASGQPVRTIAGQQFTASQQQARNAFLTQLAATLAPMKQKDRDAFIRSLPPEIRALFGTSGGVTGSTSASDGF